MNESFPAPLPPATPDFSDAPKPLLIPEDIPEVQFKAPETNEATHAIEVTEEQAAIDSLEGVVSYTERMSSNGVKRAYGETADGKLVQVKYDTILTVYGKKGQTQGKDPAETVVATPDSVVEDDPEEFKKVWGVTPEEFDALPRDEQAKVLRGDRLQLVAPAVVRPTAKPGPVIYATPPLYQTGIKRSLSEAAALGKLRWDKAEQTRVETEPRRSPTALVQTQTPPHRPESGNTYPSTPINPTELDEQYLRAKTPYAENTRNEGRKQGIAELLRTRETISSATGTRAEIEESKRQQAELIQELFGITTEQFDELLNLPLIKKRVRDQGIEYVLLNQAVRAEINALDVVLKDPELSPEDRTKAKQELQTLLVDYDEALSVPAKPAQRNKIGKSALQGAFGDRRAA